jgi:hypothetical protein
MITWILFIALVYQRAPPCGYVWPGSRHERHGKEVRICPSEAERTQRVDLLAPEPATEIKNTSPEVVASLRFMDYPRGTCSGIATGRYAFHPPPLFLRTTPAFVELAVVSWLYGRKRNKAMGAVFRQCLFFQLPAS